MNSAPPVLVSVGRFVWGWGIWACLALASGLLGVAWLWQAHAGLWPVLGLLLAWVILLGLSAVRLQQEGWPAGLLRWDGQQWWFEPTAAAATPMPVSVRPVWDGGAMLCLRLQAQSDGLNLGSAGFVCWRARDLPVQWHGLRCAVYTGDTL